MGKAGSQILDVKLFHFSLVEKYLCITEDVVLLITFHQSSWISGKIQKARLVPVDWGVEPLAFLSYLMHVHLEIYWSQWETHKGVSVCCVLLTRHTRQVCCWPFVCWVSWLVCCFSKTSLLCLFIFFHLGKIKMTRDSELLQSWILGSAAGLPKQSGLVHLARNKRCHSCVSPCSSH